MSYPFKKAFDAQAAIAGGKRELVQGIFSKLSTVFPSQKWASATFIDGFAGGGSISTMAKASGWHTIHSIDWSIRSQYVIEGLLQNSRVQITPYDLNAFLDYRNRTEIGFVQQELGEMFAQHHAKVLDHIGLYAEQVHCRTKRALIKVLQTHLTMDFSCFGTSVGKSNRPFAHVLDGKASWESLNPKRLRDKSFERLLRPPSLVIQKRVAAINNGIFGSNSQIHRYQKDVFELIPQLQGDVLYLDPPYPDTLSYSKLNAVIDQVLLGHVPKRPMPESPFTHDPNALYELLILARHIPIWLISLNNKVMDLEALQDLIKRADPSRNVAGWSRTYSYMEHVSKTTTNQELLILASKESAP